MLKNIILHEIVIVLENLEFGVLVRVGVSNGLLLTCGQQVVPELRNKVLTLAQREAGLFEDWWGRARTRPFLLWKQCFSLLVELEMNFILICAQLML